MLINLSNHPSPKWGRAQQEAAKILYGEVLDIAFPSVDPDGDVDYIENLANEYVDKVCLLAGGDKTCTVHLMGELTLTFAILKKLTKLDMECVASTSERLVKEFENGKKEVTFSFVQFRKYQ